jgi:hypothetical protein
MRPETGCQAIMVVALSTSYSILNLSMHVTMVARLNLCYVHFGYLALIRPIHLGDTGIAERHRARTRRCRMTQRRWRPWGRLSAEDGPAASCARRAHTTKSILLLDHLGFLLDEYRGPWSPTGKHSGFRVFLFTHLCTRDAVFAEVYFYFIQCYAHVL